MEAHKRKQRHLSACFDLSPKFPPELLGDLGIIALTPNLGPLGSRVFQVSSDWWAGFSFWFYEQNRWLVSERAVGQFLVVISTSNLQLLCRIHKAQEPMSVQAFLLKLAVEGFDESIARRLAWSAEIQNHALVICPQIQVSWDKLRPIIDANGLGTTNLKTNPF